MSRVKYPTPSAVAGRQFLSTIAAGKMGMFCIDAEYTRPIANIYLYLTDSRNGIPFIDLRTGSPVLTLSFDVASGKIVINDGAGAHTLTSVQASTEMPLSSHTYREMFENLAARRPQGEARQAAARLIEDILVGTHMQAGEQLLTIAALHHGKPLAALANGAFLNLSHFANAIRLKRELDEATGEAHRGRAPDESCTDRGNTAPT